MKLSAKQIRFIDEYMVDFNGAAAAVRAGYSPISAKVTASRMLSHANLQAVLRERQGIEASRLQITRQQAIQGLLEGIGMARLLGNPAAMISGWKEIAKMLGFYEPERHAVKLSAESGALRAKFEVMTDAELLAIMAEEVNA